MSSSMFGEEGYSNPILDNKFFFCIKNPEWIDAIILMLDSEEVQEWRQRIEVFSETDLFMSAAEKEALNEEYSEDPIKLWLTIAARVATITQKFEGLYGN